MVSKYNESQQEWKNVLCRICQTGILTELPDCIVMTDDDGVRGNSG